MKKCSSYRNDLLFHVSDYNYDWLPVCDRGVQSASSRYWRYWNIIPTEIKVRTLQEPNQYFYCRHAQNRFHEYSHFNELFWMKIIKSSRYNTLRRPYKYSYYLLFDRKQLRIFYSPTSSQLLLSFATRISDRRYKTYKQR